MSLRYNDKNNVETVVSGLTPGGNLETGAVAIREGILNIPVVSSSGYITSITFAEPMPDADYEISLCDDETSISGKTMLFNLFNKTANGFSILCHRLNLGDSVAFKLHWTAFKLYTVADAEQLYSTVQDIEAMVPANASSSNKFSTAGDLQSAANALDLRLDDVEDIIPSTASIINKLATQEDIDNISIDELGDIQDVNLTNLEDGQTLVWDDTNSKWVNGQGGKTYTAGDGIEINSSDEISTDPDLVAFTFTGTKSEWDALTAAQKAKYNIANITDDMVPGTITSYVGMVIESTTLDTMEKVIEVYGGTTWISHSGYVLRGATSGVTANSAIKTGGNDDAIVVSHSHTTGVHFEYCYQAGSGIDAAHYLLLNAATGSAPVNLSTTANGSSGTNANIPNYKSVYIWERTA